MLKFMGSSYDPIPSFVKVNFNATISKEKICPVAIRRNHKREVIFVWTEIIKDQDLLITKTKVAHSAKKKKTKNQGCSCSSSKGNKVGPYSCNL